MIKDTDVETAQMAIIKLKEISSELLDGRYLNEDNSIGILGGSSGIIMFLFHYAQYSDDIIYSEVGKEYVYQLFDKINAGNIGTTFCNGLAGTIWLLDYLVKNNFIEFDIDDNAAPLDEYLAICMQKDIDSNNYDFLHGAIGYGMYFLERYKNTNNDKYKQEYLKYIYQLINFFEESSIEYNNTIYWECENNQEPKHVNLGLAHGIPSIICFLAKVYNVNIEKERIKNLLEQSVSFILK